MKTYTAKFRTDADFATREFRAASPAKALRIARKFLANQAEDLMFEAYDYGMPVNEIAICGEGNNKLAVWYDEDMRLRVAAGDLLRALDDQTDAAQAVIDNWEKGDLAGAVRALDASIAAARAALAKAKGD